MNRKVHRVYFNASGRTELAQENNKWTVTVTKKESGVYRTHYKYMYLNQNIIQRRFLFRHFRLTMLPSL